MCICTVVWFLPSQNHWFISCVRAWDEALFTVADTSSYLGVSAEYCSLRLSAQTVSCEGTGSLSLSYVLGYSRIKKEATSRFPSCCIPKEYQKSVQAKGTMSLEFSATQITLKRTPTSSTLPSNLQWDSREPLTPIPIPYQLLPRAKEPARTLGSSWITLQVHNRSCSSPGLRVEEGVHAKILCFWVGGLKWRDERGICAFRSGPATLPS